MKSPSSSIERVSSGSRSIVVAALGLASSAPARAEEPPEASSRRLEEVVITGRADSLLGLAESATEGTVGARQRALRPTLRAGELLETVPGVIITQHAGGGKANQYFLRGMNLDHGTDLATTLDGMPLNLTSHGHSHGYSDMNIVIPELVERVDYQKGVYYAENGDFSSAGAAHLRFYERLPQTLLIAEGGMYGFARGLVAASPKLGPGYLLYGLELFHHDGPWERGDDYLKLNGLVTYSQGDAENGFRMSVRGYRGIWNSSDQVALSAVEDGLVPFFGALDDTTGGEAQRYSLQGEWRRTGRTSTSRLRAYGFYADLDLFSNFTYFLSDRTRGDQFEQTDRRWVAGLSAMHSVSSRFGGLELDNMLGLQARGDLIENGLFQTQDRLRVSKVDSLHADFPLSATTREDRILVASVGVYFENRVRWAEWLRSSVGLRGDLFHFDVNSRVHPENSAEKTATITSPKLSLIFGPWAETEVYLQGGFGFHSNDARAVTARVDPLSGNRENLDGELVQAGAPLVRSRGAELGVRSLLIPDLQSTVSLWALDFDSELVFVGDAGTTEASRPSRRYGVEWANYYTPSRYWTLDADLSFSHAEFRDEAPEGRHVPGSIQSVIAAGITLHDFYRSFSSLRLRYFGPRPLIEDNSFRSGATLLLSVRAGHQLTDQLSVTVEVINLLNRRDHDIDYAYESRVTPSAEAVEQLHFHPVEPFQARLALSARFL